MTPCDITGRCHCGRVEFRLHWPRAAGVLTARACQCDFCRMHGARWTSHPEAAVSATLPADESLIRYRFGHGSAEFIVCAVCGILTLALDQRGAGPLAVVNVNTFESLDPDGVATVETDFDGESPAARDARRRRNWSPLTSA